MSIMSRFRIRKAAISCMAASILLLGVQGVAQANIMTNGGFESGDFPPGWSRLPDPANGLHTMVVSSGFGIVPHEGNYFATFSNNVPQVSGISQTVATTPGQVYNLSCWFTNTIGSDQLNDFKITWNDGVVLDLFNFAQLPWTEFSLGVTGTGSDTVTFSGYQNLGWNGLDSVSLDPVPEPTTLAVLLIGGAAMWRRSRK